MTRPVTRSGPTLTLETLLAARVGGPVCGVDEAGRGPWAGPVSAGAVILNPDDLPAGIDDSKALTHKARERLEIEIKEKALAWGVGFASVEEIDGSNILKATGLAMQRAVRVNEAYQRLKDPLSRAAYLCELRGVPIDAERNTALPSAFLMQQMEWREALEEADAPAAVQALDARVAALERSLQETLTSHLDQDQDPAAAAAQVRALMFVARFRQDIDRRLDLLDTHR